MLQTGDLCRFDKILPVTRQIIETRDLNIPPFEFNTTGVWVDSTTMQSWARCLMVPTLTQEEKRRLMCG